MNNKSSTNPINLIGINGRIHSGKDTVGTIIQWLTNRFDQDLKTPFEIEKGQMYHPGSPWQIKKYALKLKQIASLLTGIPAELFEDQEFKKTELGPEWFLHKYKPRVEGTPTAPKFTGEPYDTHMTVRELLQKLGTDAIRNNLHPDAWVNALFADYKPECYDNGMVVYRDEQGRHTSPEHGKPGGYSKWLITDTRFPNEVKAIKDRGGIVVRVNRGTKEFHPDFPLHESETALDHYPFDYYIDNSGSIEHLVSEVQKMLRHYNII